MEQGRQILGRIGKFVLIAALALTSIAGISDAPPQFSSDFCLFCSCSLLFDPGCGGTCAIATFTGCGPGGDYSCDGCC